MKQSASKKLYVILPLLLILCVVCVLLYNAGSPSALSSASGDAIPLDSEWTLLSAGEAKEDVPLPISMLPDAPGQVSLTHTVPAQRPENSALCIFFYTAPFTVSFNGEELYKYGTAAALDGYQSVGSGFHIIELPDGAGELRITAYLADNIPGAILSEASLMPGAAFLSQFLRGHIFTIAAVFILFAVFVYTLISGGSRLGKSAGSTQPLALLAITAAIWLSARSGLLQLFINDLVLINGIDFLSFFSLPVFALSFVQRRLLLPDRRLTVCLAANLLFIFASCTLHVLRIADFTQSLFIFHLLLATSIVCIVISVFRAGPARVPHMNVLRAGVVILACGGALELVTYYVMSFQFLRFSFFEFSLLAFTLCMLYVWNSESREIREQLISQSKFRKMAYRDELTGILNRAAYEREAEKWAQAQTPFYLFMVDLNGLKRINDTRGHQAGDVFICNAVSLLKQVAGAPGQLFRFGGDEFIIILPGSEESAEALYRFLQPYIRPNDGSLRPCFSVGYAAFDPADGEDLHSVLRRADKRMYACKSRLRASE